MAQYKIENTTTAVILGIYEANSAVEAYNLMLVDAGEDIVNDLSEAPDDIDVSETEGWVWNEFQNCYEKEGLSSW